MPALFNYNTTINYVNSIQCLCLSVDLDAKCHMQTWCAGLFRLQRSPNLNRAGQARSDQNGVQRQVTGQADRGELAPAAVASAALLQALPGLGGALVAAVAPGGLLLGALGLAWGRRLDLQSGQDVRCMASVN